MQLDIWFYGLFLTIILWIAPMVVVSLIITVFGNGQPGPVNLGTAGLAWTMFSVVCALGWTTFCILARLHVLMSLNMDSPRDDRAVSAIVSVRLRVLGCCVFMRVRPKVQRLRVEKNVTVSDGYYETLFLVGNQDGLKVIVLGGWLSMLFSLNEAELQSLTRTR